MTTKLEDILTDFAVFISVSDNTTSFAGSSGKKSPIGDWSGKIESIEDLMKAGFVLPIPRNKISRISTSAGLNNDIATATIQIKNPYSDTGLYDTTYKSATDYSSNKGKYEETQLKLFRKQERTYKDYSEEVEGTYQPEPGEGETFDDGVPSQSQSGSNLGQLYHGFTTFVKKFLSGIIKNKEEWREMMQDRREKQQDKGFLSSVFKDSPLGGMFEGANAEYVEDYINYKYAFNIEDMSPVWIVAKVRDDISSPEIDAIRDELNNIYGGYGVGDFLGQVVEDVPVLGSLSEDRSKYAELWVFMFHGFVSTISEEFTGDDVYLNLTCKSFLDYMGHSDLRTQFTPIYWFQNQSLKMSDVLSKYIEPIPWLKDWFTKKSPKTILSHLVYLLNSTHTYLGRKKFREAYQQFDTYEEYIDPEGGGLVPEDAESGGDEIGPLDVRNFFHYDYFWLPENLSASGEEKEKLDEGRDITDEEDGKLIEKSNKTFMNEDVYKVVLPYSGGLELITTMPSRTVPSLAYDVYTLLESGQKFDDLAYLWWFGQAGSAGRTKLESSKLTGYNQETHTWTRSGTEFDPNDNLNKDFSVRNRWKPRVYMDKYIISRSIFAKSIISGFNITSTGGIISGYDLLDKLVILMDAFYYTDGKGNLICQLARWDDYPKCKTWKADVGENRNVSGALDYGWSPLNNLIVYGKEYGGGSPIENPVTHEIESTANELDNWSIHEAVFDDYDTRYIVTDEEHSFSFGFDESKIKTYFMTDAKKDWIELVNFLQMYINTVVETLDEDESQYFQTKYGIRQLNTTINNPDGLFGEEFIGDLGNDLGGGGKLGKAYNEALFRRELRRASVGQLTLGNRVDLQLGRPMIHGERQKTTWPESIRHDIDASGGTPTTTMSLGMVRDFSDLVGNPFLEALVAMDWDRIKLEEHIEEEKEQAEDSDGNPIVFTNCGDITQEEIEANLVNISHSQIQSNAGDSRGTSDLRDAIYDWITRINDKLDRWTYAGTDVTGWRLFITSLYRSRGTTAGLDAGGKIDANFTNGHWRGMSVDIDRTPYPEDEEDREGWTCNYLATTNSIIGAVAGSFTSTGYLSSYRIDGMIAQCAFAAGLYMGGSYNTHPECNHFAIGSYTRCEDSDGMPYDGYAPEEGIPNE